MQPLHATAAYVDPQQQCADVVLFLPGARHSMPIAPARNCGHLRMLKHLDYSVSAPLVEGRVRAEEPSRKPLRSLDLQTRSCRMPLRTSDNTLVGPRDLH